MVEHILTGYRVLDLTHVLAGPTATRMMAEMGAEVIKVEFPPLGDIARSLPVKINGRSGYYVQQNRGKKSISVDIKTESGKIVLEDLIKCSDIFPTNFCLISSGKSEIEFCLFFISCLLSSGIGISPS